MKRLAALVAMFVASGCDAPPPAGGADVTSPGGRGPGVASGIDVVQFRIQPSAPGVEKYGAPVLHRPSPVEKEVHAQLRGIKAAHEPALSRMARELAATTPDRFNIPPALVDELMAWSGMVDPPPRLTVVELGPDAPDCVGRMEPRCKAPIASLVEQVVATMPETGNLAYGVGAARAESGAARFIVAVLERAAKIDAMPNRFDRGGSVKVSGRLLGGRSRPSVEVVDPAGVWQAMPTLTGDDNTFAAKVPCTVEGAYQVELLVEGEHGPEVAANFPVYCGAEPPTVLDVELERLGPRVTAEQVARANFDYLNEERAQRGLTALEWDRKAARIALDHSKDMHANGFVGHRSPTTGDVTQRFKAANMRGTVIRENVARGYGPKQIHQSLMRSPGHRVNILADDVTHVGIGVVVGSPETDAAGAPRPLFATQNFFRDPEAAAAQQGDPVEALRELVDRQRKAAGLGALEWHATLMSVADKHARAVARGRKPTVDQALERDLAGAGFATIDRHHVESNDVSGFAGLDLWKDASVKAVGIGVAERKTKDGTMYVLIIFVVR